MYQKAYGFFTGDDNPPMSLLRTSFCLFVSVQTVELTLRANRGVKQCLPFDGVDYFVIYISVVGYMFVVYYP